jgi:phosphate transport system substrate-binding protein
MLEAMAEDPLAIGYAGLVYHNPDVKAVALSESDDGPFVMPTKEHVIDHTYALKRMITMFFNRAPGRPVDPKIKEFLRYVLSREGQQAVLTDGHGYLPVLAPFANHELEKLED